MEEIRREDPRIYIVSALFFSCIVSGGVFLGLYIFLPPKQVRHWYPSAGLILVGIPWGFWFLTYIYRCIRPEPPPPRKSFTCSPSVDAAGSAAIAPPSPSPNDDECGGGSETQSPGDGARHVHFGGVVVITDDDNGNNVDEQRDGDDQEQRSDKGRREGGNAPPSCEKDSSVSSRESEMPLTRSVSSS